MKWEEKLNMKLNQYTHETKIYTVRDDMLLVDLGSVVKTSSVIITTNEAAEQKLLVAKMDGVVKAVGKDLQDTYKVGDRVFFPRYSGTDVSRTYTGELKTNLLRVMSGDVVLGFVSEVSE